MDHYFSEGKRDNHFLGENVIKYYRTLATSVNTLLQNGFEIVEIAGPMPDPKLLPQYNDQLCRPMFFIIQAIKK